MRKRRKAFVCSLICVLVIGMMSGNVYATESGIPEVEHCPNDHTMARVLQSGVFGDAWNNNYSLVLQIECLDGCIFEAEFAPTFFINGIKYEGLSKTELEEIKEMIPHNVLLRFKGNESGQFAEIDFDTSGDPFWGTMVLPTENGFQVQVALENVAGNCNVYIAGYQERRLVEIKSITYAGQNMMSATFAKNVNEIKIMAWEESGNLRPICPEEDIVFE